MKASRGDCPHSIPAEVRADQWSDSLCVPFLPTRSQKTIDSRRSARL